MKAYLTLIIIFMCITIGYTQNASLTKANQAVANSISPKPIYKSSSTSDVTVNTVNVVKVERQLLFDQIYQFQFDRDYGNLVNRDPALGVRNTPANRIIRRNTINNLNYNYNVKMDKKPIQEK